MIDTQQKKQNKMALSVSRGTDQTEAYVGYYKLADDKWQCSSCQKLCGGEFDIWRHIVSSAKCQEDPQVRNAVQQYLSEPRSKKSRR